MKNTPENKAKFFAQYWGQKVKGSHLPDQKGIEELNYQHFRIFHTIINGYLELKSLSQIADEEALIAYRYHWTPEVFEDKEEMDKYDTPHAVEWLKNYGKPKYIKLTLEGTDFLRSRGYALPWMGISVEEQIEFGWVKLKEL